MPTKTIIIDDVPKGQRRPRFAKRGNFVTTFDPDKQDKLWIKHLCATQIENIIDGPIEMQLIAYMPIPKSTSKKKIKAMLANEIKHTKMPDGDNIYKKYSDALNGLAYHDDRQIWKFSVEKLYSENPHTKIIMSWD